MEKSTEKLSGAVKQPSKQPLHKNKGRKWGRPFVPGQSGNPNGRPKKAECITSRQKEKMNEVCPIDGAGRTWLEALAEGGMRQALFTPTALSNLQDRLEGKVTQPVATDGTITLRIVYDDSD